MTCLLMWFRLCLKKRFDFFFKFCIFFFKVTCLNVPLREGLGKQHVCLFPKVTDTLQSTTPCYYTGDLGGRVNTYSKVRAPTKGSAMMVTTRLLSTLWFKPMSRLHPVCVAFRPLIRRLESDHLTQRNVGGFESEHLDLPVNTLASSTGRDFFHDSLWRCLLLLVCGCYNDLILQGIVSGCPLRQLLFWGG